MSPQKILVTGAAGFIGFHLSRFLLDRGESVVGCDNLNDYYDVRLKQDRLALLEALDTFEFHRVDIADRDSVQRLFESQAFDVVASPGGVLKVV